jgi:hypothetical protein
LREGIKVVRKDRGKDLVAASKKEGEETRRISLFFFLPCSYAAIYTGILWKLVCVLLGSDVDLSEHLSLKLGVDLDVNLDINLNLRLNFKVSQPYLNKMKRKVLW